MNNFDGLGLNGMRKTSRKRRTNLNRRPPNELESPKEYRDSIPLSSTPSDLVSDALNEQNAVYAETDQKSSGGNGLAGDIMSEKQEAASDGIENENKVKKVKLKVGGVTHTIQTRSSFESFLVAGTSATSHQESSDFVVEKGFLCGVPWKDFSRTGFSFQKEESMKQAPKHDRSYKIKSVSKKPMFDEVYDDENDDEIRYLRKLKSSKTPFSHDMAYEDETRGKKLQSISRVMDRSNKEYVIGLGVYDSSKSGNESKKSRSVSTSDPELSDCEIETRHKKQKWESLDVLEISETGSSITTRQRASLTGRDNSPSLDVSLIQFPDGLPPAPPRKQKVQLSEVELQLKKAEAAQRRRMQNEKAALESQAEAIRKILCQDSRRKKREDKIKKRKEELARERTMNAATVASVRWVMGPSGTIVTFPNEIGLPSIFEPKPCRYPPQREKCAGPSCTNVYKYRDSKSKLPLCSLQCYKAIHEKRQYLTAC